MPQRPGDPPRDIKFAFIGYRDHPHPPEEPEHPHPPEEPEEGFYVTKVQPLSDELTIADFVSKIVCAGGGDRPEAVLDGLKAAIDETAWREKSMRFIFHIGDAPSHGLEYTGKKSGDYWPGGCPCNITLDSLVPKFEKKHIKYTFLKISSYPNLMAQIF